MKIISKRQTMAIHCQHPESHLFRYCTGHYQWYGSVDHYIEKEIQDINGVLAFYSERRQNRFGPYTSLRSVTLN